MKELVSRTIFLKKMVPPYQYSPEIHGPPGPIFLEKNGPPRTNFPEKIGPPDQIFVTGLGRMCRTLATLLVPKCTYSSTRSIAHKASKQSTRLLIIYSRFNTFDVNISTEYYLYIYLSNIIFSPRYITSLLST